MLIDVNGGLGKDKIFHGLMKFGMDGVQPEFADNFKFINLVKAFLN
jgi:hypothetical protein